MANIASRVLLKRSTNPSLRGWYGVVFVFTVPSNSEIYAPWYCQILFPGLNVETCGSHLSINASATERAVLSARG